MDCIEIDDDGPQQPPPERALWCAVLATFAEDIELGLAALHNADLIERACIIASLDNILDELVSEHCEAMCDFARVDYGRFADRLIARIQEGIHGDCLPQSK